LVNEDDLAEINGLIAKRKRALETIPLTAGTRSLLFYIKTRLEDLGVRPKGTAPKEVA
jgi:hypothetical protein